MARVIDVWDLDTFDEDLMALSCANAELVRHYLVADPRTYNFIGP